MKNMRPLRYKGKTRLEYAMTDQGRMLSLEGPLPEYILETPKGLRVYSPVEGMLVDIIDAFNETWRNDTRKDA